MSDFIKKILKNPKLYFIFAFGRICKGSDKADERYLKMLFQYRLKRKLDFSKPVTFNEKLQWMKIYDKNDLYTKLVDKYEVRKFVEEKIGKDYLVPLLGVWDSFHEIDFNELPQSFVLKCTHDSGGLVVCKNKDELDLLKTEKKITRCLKRNYYFNSREWPYKNVPRRIIAEEFIGKIDELPVDYKFFCFNGKIDSVMLCMGRELGRPDFVFFDTEWNRLWYQGYEPELKEPIVKPENFEVMIEVVEKLAQGLREVRVDLYNIDGKIYFGEMTFFNQSGFDLDITYDTDKKWGQKLILPS